LFMDLDNFKAVNDALGHAAGDQLLIDVAQRILGSLRPGDTAARFGGDEFALLIEDVELPADAVLAGERILQALHKPFDLDGREVVAHTSIGIALSDSDDAGV